MEGGVVNMSGVPDIELLMMGGERVLCETDHIRVAPLEEDTTVDLVTSVRAVV